MKRVIALAITVTVPASAGKGAGANENMPPEQQSEESAWDHYWNSLGADEQEKLSPHVGNAHAWFSIGEVWGQIYGRAESAPRRKSNYETNPAIAQKRNGKLLRDD